jgi:uncharacterized membrane protein
MKNIFIRGLITVAPLAITIALLVWIFSALESIFKTPVQAIIGQYYFPGLGVLVALVLIFFIGMIINNFLIQKIYNFGENILKHIPLVKTLYNSVSELMRFFRANSKEDFGQVVLLDLNGMSIIGFVTRDNLVDIDEGFVENQDVAVYVPFSYQIGGYTFFVNKSKIKPLDMSVDRAMRLAITAGILKDKKLKKD